MDSRNLQIGLKTGQHGNSRMSSFSLFGFGESKEESCSKQYLSGTGPPTEQDQNAYYDCIGQGEYVTSVGTGADNGEGFDWGGMLGGLFSSQSEKAKAEAERAKAEGKTTLGLFALGSKTQAEQRKQQTALMAMIFGLFVIVLYFVFRPKTS